MYLGRCIHINIKEPVLFPARVHIKPRIAVRAGILPEVSSDTYSKCYHGQTCLSVNSSKTMMKWDQREVSRASDSWFLTQLWKGLKEVPEPNQSRGGGKNYCCLKQLERHGVPTAALCHHLWWGIIFLLPAVSFLFSQTHTPFCWNIAANEFLPILGYLLTVLSIQKININPSHLPLPSDSSTLFFFFSVCSLSFFQKHFVLGCCRLTMLWCVWVNSEGTQPYMCVYPFSPKPPSHPGWHIALSRVPCAIQ